MDGGRAGGHTSDSTDTDAVELYFAGLDQLSYLVFTQLSSLAFLASPTAACCHYCQEGVPCERAKGRWMISRRKLPRLLSAPHMPRLTCNGDDIDKEQSLLDRHEGHVDTLHRNPQRPRSLEGTPV